MGNAPSIVELDHRFGIPGVAQVLPGNSGLPKVRIAPPTCSGEMYLHGAHVTSWQPEGAAEVFFVSPNARWQEGLAIRGGVPICFPWFGDKRDDPKAPAHGFVRTKSWELNCIALAGNDVTVSMSTGTDEDAKLWWPADFRLYYRVTFGHELRLELELHNIGTAALRFEEALHSYHAVGEVHRARLSGLDGVHYVDKTDAFKRKIQQGDVVLTEETDRVYLNTSSSVELTDSVLGRRIRVTKGNSMTTVVWNPWTEKASTMADLGADQWTRMFCIETSNVLDCAVDLPAGEKHCMSAVIQIEPM